MALSGGRTSIDKLNQRFYPNHVHPRQIFRKEVLSRLKSTDVLLDFGAGRGRSEVMDFKDIVSRVCGVDVTPAVLTNPRLDEAKLISDGNIPYDDATFDVVCSLYVLEHLEEPLADFAEIRRVLRPGGLFMAFTPNVFHYMPLVARMTPHSFHQFVMRKLHRRDEEDTFATYYRANSIRSIKRIARALDLRVLDVKLWEDRPTYLRMSAPLYLIGIGYERLVSSTELLRGLRSNICCVLQKSPD